MRGTRATAVLIWACVLASAGRGPSAAQAPITLPTQVASNVFFARVHVNDIGPFWFTVDTGATLTVIDPATARRAGLVVRAAGHRSNVGVGGGATELSTAAAARIDVAGLPSFAPPFVYVVAVQQNASLLGHQIDGVLGTDLLMRHVVEFDWAAERITLGPTDQPDPPARRTVPVTLDGNVFVAPAMVTLPDQTRVLARLLVDTGSNGALTLTTPFVRWHNLVARFPSRKASLAVGINGSVASPVIELPAVSFGDATIVRANAALSQAADGLNASSDFDGIIGAELLRQFRVRIDYPGRTMGLR